MNQLIRIDRARQELIEARAIPEVKTILDKAEAIATFTKQQNYSKEIVDYANEFWIDAQIKMGAALKILPKNEGVKGQLIGPGVIGATKTEGPIEDVPPTYAELNITYKDASRWQKAEEHKDEIKKKIADVKAKGQPVAANKLINQVLQGKQKEERKHNQALPLPDGKYRTIVIDPPWPVDKILRDERPNQDTFDYPTMTIDEIKKLSIPSLAYQDGCHVYLWTTHKFLPIAFEIFNHWGVKYQCLLTWVKNVGMTPFSFMYSTEHVLFGRIGSLDLLKQGERLDFSAKVEGHSIKPEIFYDLVRRVSPEPRIDVFARKKRKGFAVYGNQLAGR